MGWAEVPGAAHYARHLEPRPGVASVPDDSCVWKRASGGRASCLPRHPAHPGSHKAGQASGLLQGNRGGARCSICCAAPSHSAQSGCGGAVRSVSTDDTDGDELFNREIQDSLSALLQGERLDLIGENHWLFETDPDHEGYIKTNTHFPVEFVQAHYWADFLAAYYQRV